MKSMRKAIILFLIGLCLLFTGIGLGGLKNMNIHLLESIQLAYGKKENHNRVFDASLNNLDIEVSHANISFSKAKSDKIEIDVQNAYKGFIIEEKENKIKIKQPQYLNSSSLVNITISIPHSVHLNDIELDVGAGKVTIDEINTNKLEIEVGVGQTLINTIKAKRMKLDVGAGDAQFQYVDCDFFDGEVGIGNLNVASFTNLQNCSYDIDVGVGNVELGNEKWSGVTKHSQGHYSNKKIKIDCGMGNVTIK